MLTETLTTFLRDPRKVIARLDQEDVIIKRRDGESLRLSLESRSASGAQGTELAAHLLAQALEVSAARKALQTALEKRLPWMRFLPPDARGQLARELIETLEACASLGNTAPITQLLHAWRSTAAIHADPKLAAELTRPLPGSRRRVPAPPKPKRRRRA